MLAATELYGKQALFMLYCSEIKNSNDYKKVIKKAKIPFNEIEESINKKEILQTVEMSNREVIKNV